MTDAQWNSHHWETEGKPDGGQSYGIGWCIAWQRGSLQEQGRNGAFLIEILEACLDELEHKHKSFPCPENEEALAALQECLNLLRARIDRRRNTGTYGTHIPDNQQEIIL
jgi:hypothetical protein